MQRIGRVDRRLNPAIEEQIRTEEPIRAKIRGRVRYWNFLPPNELDRLIGIYGTLSRKALKISKTFGIEGKKLLRPEDDFDALREFNEAYEGSLTSDEEMHLALQQLLKDTPGLNLPNRIFSGKSRGTDMSQLIGKEGAGICFCYSLPGLDRNMSPDPDAVWASWTEAAGRTAWYLYDLDSGGILSDAAEIFRFIQSVPSTPRRTIINPDTLISARKKLDDHIRNTYLRQVDAPIGISPVLKAWMELS